MIFVGLFSFFDSLRFVLRNLNRRTICACKFKPVQITVKWDTCIGLKTAVRYFTAACFDLHKLHAASLRARLQNKSNLLAAEQHVKISLRCIGPRSTGWIRSEDQSEVARICCNRTAALTSKPLTRKTNPS